MKRLDEFEDCLFHGSPHAGLKTLNPHAATDLDKTNHFNNAHALFASDHIGFSIPFSLMDKNRLPEDIGAFEWSVGSTQDDDGRHTICCTLPRKLQFFIENAVGTIYVLPKTSFLENDGVQWKSTSEVVPISSFEVTVEDFYAAGGIVEWTQSPDIN